MLRRGELVLVLAVGIMASLCMPTGAQLQVGFYSVSCPMAETVVRDEVTRGMARDPGVAAGLVRMHFHDCFVRGCDGSVLIDSTGSNTAEKDSPINNPSLRGFEVIDNAKTRLEAACRSIVSCADILAFAARDSVALTGGMRYSVPAGRKDGRVSIASETFTDLPAPTLDAGGLTRAFAAKGFTQSEMVTLSGAHTLGRSHCTSFSNRLYSFNSTMSTDPSIDPAYAAQLKRQCPQGSGDASLVVPMDSRTPNIFDSSYYDDIMQNRGMFTSDQTLLSDPNTAAVARQNTATLTFNTRFAATMVKMGRIGVLTGTAGEIRANCRVIN